MSDPFDPNAFDDATVEQLNAYLDGELDPAASHRFEERLAREPALRRLLGDMRALDGELRADFGATPPTPPSDALLGAVKAFATAQIAEAPQQAGNVVSFEPRRAAQAAATAPWRLPLAASIAFVVGAGAMWLVQSPLDGGRQDAAVAIADGIAVRGGALHAALEGLRSGEIKTDGRERIRPILSFEARDGRFCREFEAFGEKGAVVGVACKGERGWAMEVLLSSAPHSPGETQYAPASGFNSKALDGVVEQLMEGQPLSPEAETSARVNGWRKGTKPGP